MSLVALEVQQLGDLALVRVVLAYTLQKPPKKKKKKGFINKTQH